MGWRSPLFAALAAFFLASRVHARMAEAETQIPRELLFHAVKCHVLAHFSQPTLEDASAGLLKFVYREEGFTDDGAVAEIVELDPDRTKLRVTIPSDYGGRAEVLLDRVLEGAKKISEGKVGREVTKRADLVYRSVLRYLLKNFVSSDKSKNNVVPVADESAGFIRFVYREKNFMDPQTTVEVAPVGKDQSRLIVSLPSDPGRRILLEDNLVRAVREDLGGEKEDSR
jgi:hypothetical protein